MERLTERCWRNLDPWECCGQDRYCKRDYDEKGGCTNGCIVPKLYARLAAYEDTGLDPEEIQALISPPNDPLTLEELREMDGEPVYCIRDVVVGVNSDKQKQVLHSEEWGIVASRDLEDCGFIIGSAYIYHLDTYSKDWLAYRRKPEKMETGREEDKKDGSIRLCPRQHEGPK